MSDVPARAPHLIGRRALLVALAAAAGPVAAQPLPGSFENWRRLFGGPEAAVDAAQRVRLLAEGEAQLAAGDAQAAQDSFQRAAMLMHAPDTECSIVRAQMQAGQYRQALAFCAHAALAHRGFAGGVALYAWLLQLGGQSVIAQRLLAEAAERQPDDEAVRIARAQLVTAWPLPQGPLLTAPLRAAPYGHGADVDESRSRLAGTATLVEGGQSALVPSATVRGARELRLRNGLGQTVRARVDGIDEATGVAVLRLEQALSMPAELAMSRRMPFAGSPAAAVEFAPGGDAAGAAWPWLRLGFFGRVPMSGPRPLGVAMPAGARGGPVFDRAGLLAGMSLPGPDGTDRLLAVSEWPVASGLPEADAVPGAPAAPVDAVYEAALRLALQVIVDTAA